MQVQTRKHIYTPEEYLELEEKALYKSEYRDGEIIPMTGGTTNHNQIALNFASSLLYVIRGKKYRYRSIPQFKEYVLVEQNQYQVMHYSKTNEGEWIFREYKSENYLVKLQHLDFEISLVDIYQDVNFDDKE
ncbi:hypothetical protein FJR38_15290 [Anabaena sp. UHCC 0253]|uniref:Uma2 family endonuclease n=1 Tax=Anabaena sp. UHCC 0253 TaxID=2590019 RepID=UPI001447900E|nr:Uma2 family endonuclease [Anabaena sp. UHCC 0253]MTJ53911.1 hypothetical protein [Anabaena sp. UHCC 0253]